MRGKFGFFAHAAAFVSTAEAMGEGLVRVVIAIRGASQRQRVVATSW